MYNAHHAFILLNVQVSSAGDAAGDVATLLKTVRKVAIDGKSQLLFLIYI
jgi:hypothetical protein